VEIDIDMRSQVPSYRQLADQIAAAIESGEYGPDEAIPSLRDLQQQSGLAMATVQHAIRVLVERDLVVSVSGRGTFVKGKA
jgi:DNA-binding GntR family transcriptional regulator